MSKKHGIGTIAIHGGQKPEELTGSVTYPIFQTSTYEYDAPGKPKEFEYSRTGNPTRQVLEANLASLENGKHGHAFSSGMGAITTIMLLLKSGDHVLCTDNVYGGTFRFFRTIMQNFGLEFDFINTSDTDLVKNSIKSNTKMIFLETPTNPMMNICDLKAISDIAREQNILTVVDNTFMSPYFQRPLEHGIDITLHSTTKYINGHSDVVGGATVVNDDELAQKIGYTQNGAGAVPGPFDSWLVLRSTKTLAVRMRQHDINGRAVAKMLKTHPKVEKVFYPGLEDHPQHELAKRQMDGFGGMVSANLKDFESAKNFAANLKIFTLAESLGGVESLLCHPTSMTHASVPKEERLKFGLTDGLVRFSVGIEDTDDLLTDISEALDKI